MSYTYEAAVLNLQKEGLPEVLSDCLANQSAPPISVKTYAEGGPGTQLTAAIRSCSAEFLLVLDARAVPISSNFSERLLRRLRDDPGLSAVYACMYAKKSARSLNKIMDEEWLTEKESFGLRDFYELGPEVFMMPMTACMLRVSDVKAYFLEPKGLARPEYEMNAHLLYDGKKIAKIADAAVDFSPGLSFVRCFRESFRFGAALKLYYTSFGLSWKNTALKMDAGFTKHARRSMKRALKSGAFWTLPAVPVRMLSALLGDFLGENYHRLPLRLDRFLSSDPYFS